MNRAVFFDRDGTLIQEKEYLHLPEDVAIFPGAAGALKAVIESGFHLFMVTNQSGVGRGYFTMDDVERVHARIADELARDGVKIEKIYVSPDAPDQPSRYRKPSPQFLFDARDEFGLDLAQSYMIGDKFIDVETGWNAKVKQCILVRTGYGSGVERDRRAELRDAIVVDGLPEAADYILHP